MLLEYFGRWRYLNIKRIWDHELDLEEEEDHPSFWDEHADTNLYIEEDEIKQSRDETEDWEYELFRFWTMEYLTTIKKHIWDEEFEYIGI